MGIEVAGAAQPENKPFAPVQSPVLVQAYNYWQGR